MSCPDWRALTAEREARRADPQGWQAALEHLEACPRCGRRALAADPTLVFRRLPSLPVSAADVESMRRAVATLRRADRVSSPAAGRRLPWLRAAAAAALAALALALAPAGGGHRGEVGAQQAALPGRGLAAVPSASIEDLDLPAARVYQLAEEEITVVWVVDESLDV